MSDYVPGWRALGVAALLAAILCPPAAAQARGAAVRNGDYIVAVINQELVTAGEVDLRMLRVQQDAQRGGPQVPAEPELRKQVLDALIEERVIVTHARDSGVKIDELDLDRAVQTIATQNQLSLEGLRERLRQEGIEYARFRSNLRDQMMVERVREREVYQRIRITDLEVDRLVDQQRAAAQADAEFHIAQILVALPEGADAATRAQRKARADEVLARARRGEAFGALAREFSDDASREKGGELGMRAASRWPDAFVDAVRGLEPGAVAPALVSSGAGYHVLRLVDRRDGGALRVAQTHARHILLRVSPQLNAEAASRRLLDLRREIESGRRSFDDAARVVSEDGSASSGGDLGWASPGQFVPEFEDAMNKLPIGGISAPLVSRFGVHLIQVMERREVALETKQLREQARNILREQKFEQAYTEWTQDLRSRAYVEMREPPL